MAPAEAPARRLMGKQAGDDKKVRPSILKTKAEKGDKLKGHPKVEKARAEAAGKGAKKEKKKQMDGKKDGKTGAKEKKEKKEKKDKKDKKQKKDKKEKKEKPDAAKKDGNAAGPSKTEAAVEPSKKSKKEKGIEYVPVLKDAISPIFDEPKVPAKRVRFESPVATRVPAAPPTTSPSVSTPLSGNAALVDTSDAGSEAPSATSTALIADLNDLRKAQEAASKQGISLEEYLTRHSADILEQKLEQEMDDHMTQLQMEQAVKRKEAAEKQAAAEAAEKAEQEKQKAEKEAAEKAEQEKQKAENEAAEKAEQEKAEKEAAEKAEQEKQKAEKEAAKKAEAEKEKAEKEAAEKAEAEKPKDAAKSADDPEDGAEEADGAEEGDSESSSDEGSDHEDGSESDGCSVSVSSLSDCESENEDEQKQPTEGKMAVVVAAASKAETLTGDDVKPNSVSHRNEWKKFSRQCLDRKKFPAELASHVLKSKTDVFAEWLKADEDWSKVKLIFERRSEEVRSFKKKRGGMKRREIEQRYPGESFG